MSDTSNYIQTSLIINIKTYLLLLVVQDPMCTGQMVSKSLCVCTTDMTYCNLPVHVDVSNLLITKSQMTKKINSSSEVSLLSNSSDEQWSLQLVYMEPVNRYRASQ